MSYTIPDYVDTNAQAILAIASAVKDEAVNATDGTVRGALDALGDALAGHDIDVPQTSNGAILALAQYVSGGGGGGVDVGAPTLVVTYNRAPEIGDYIPYSIGISGVTIGGTVIVPVDPDNAIFGVASGATATTRPDIDLSPTACTAYVVTVDDEEFTAVEPWDGTLTQGTSGGLNVWSFTVPALEYDSATFSGQALYLYMH